MTGPSTPAIGGSTCREQVNHKTSSLPVTVPDIVQGKETYYSCVAILPLRSGTDERNANATLIAAAPDLLKACEALIEQVEADHAHLMGDHEGACDDPHVIDTANAARAAIARTKGK